jgi:hypothetical protein
VSQKAPAQPPAPDPTVTARAQSEFNTDAARLNARLNRNSTSDPYGTVQSSLDPRAQQWLDSRIAQDRQATIDQGGDLDAWQQRVNTTEARNFLNRDNPYADMWTQTTTLSPEQQALYDQTVQGQRLYGDIALNQLRGIEGRGAFQFDGPALRDRPDFTGIGDPNQSREAVEQALLSRINPDLERERSALEARLAAQGITMGSEMWNTGMQDWQRMANDARFGAVREGGAEQSRMFGLGLGQAQFGNQARGQSLQEQLALRALPINEAAALLSGQQVQMPQFQQMAPVQVQAPDYAGAVGQNYAGQMSAWNANTQRIGQQNAAMANLAGQLAGAGTSYLTGGASGLGFGRR